MSTKKESNLNNSTRLFNKVMAIPKKKMSQAEKVMFSYIISFNINKQVFDADNKFLARVLGESIQSITDYITRLEAMGLIEINYERKAPSEGSYYITKRIINVIDLNGWTGKNESTPDVPLVPKKNSRKKTPVEIITDAPAIAKEVEPERNVIETKPEPPVETKPEIKEVEVKPEPAPETNLLQPETSFDVKAYLTPAKLEFAKKFEKDGLNIDELFNYDKDVLDKFFYAGGILQYKTVEVDGVDRWENINGINLYYGGAGTRLTLFIYDEKGKKDAIELNETDYYDYLDERNIDFGGLTESNFDTLRQYKKQPLKMYS